MHNVVLDTIKLALIFFSLKSFFFFKNAENSYFFCMGCQCKPWSMSDNLKIQKFKIIIIKKFCQKKSSLLLLYQLWKAANFRSFTMHSNCKTVQPLVFWVTKVFVNFVWLQTQPKVFQKLNLERKNQSFWFMEKHLSYNFHLWKNVYHRDFIQCSVRMALYGIVWQEVFH